MECKHEHFFVQANVIRLTADNIVPEKIVGYCADIKIYCSECHQPFEFIGVPVGISNSRPMVSFDGTEIRMPLKPSTIAEKKTTKEIDEQKN